MNRPPEESIRVDAETLRPFARTVLERAGMNEERAAFLADLLVTNDLRGIFSHGTRLLRDYTGQFRKGRLNPRPEVRVTSETPTTLTVDGDGSVGYFAAHHAATLLTAKAREMGVAVAVTGNHGHIGAAGIYARVALEHDLFGYVTSGHQLHLKPGQNVLHAAGGSPMAFAIPTGEEPPFVLDFGATVDLYPTEETTQKAIEMIPGVVFRCFGLGCACQALGGFLAGIPVDPARAERRWEGANQGSFILMVDLDRLFPMEQLKREMDEYARQVRQMAPITETDEASLPGGVEWQRERRYSDEGIPLSPHLVNRLRELAADFDLPATL